MGIFCANIEPLEERKLLSAVEGTSYRDLNAGPANLEVELREVPAPATVKGIVFGDINGDGIMDGDDRPADRALVVITSNGVPIQSMTTGPDGAYEFSVDTSKPGLEVGVYGLGDHRFRDPTISLSLVPGESKTIILPSRMIFLPAYGEVTGVVFQDGNGNGLPDPGEKVFSGLGVYYDANLNGRFDEGEAKFITDSQGRYGRMMLEVGDDGFGLSFDPPGGGWTWRVLPFGANHEKNIAVTPPSTWTPPRTGKISGRVFDDVNSNGVRDGGERFMAGVSVTVDVPFACDEVCVIPQLLLPTRTDAKGRFRFDSVSTGQRHVSAFGEGAVYADRRNALVMVVAGETSTIDIPVQAFAVISGRVLEAGRRGPVAVVGARVYLDQNKNGKRDRGELRQLTTQTGYSFYRAPGGRFTVRLERVPPHVRPDSTASSGLALRGRAVNFKDIVLSRKETRLIQPKPRGCPEQPDPFSSIRGLMCRPVS